MFLITRRMQFGPQTFLWDVQAPDVARAARPGHFVMARIDERGERIPLTVADFNSERGTVTVVISAGEVTGFVKVSLSPLSTELVRAEAAALTFLASVPLAHLRPPRLLHHGRWRGHAVLVQEAEGLDHLLEGLAEADHQP